MKFENLAGPYAFVVHENRVFFARGRIEAGAPRSPAVMLIQGLYDSEPSQARKILRNRIYLSYQPTIMCREMIRVAAKRFTSLHGDRHKAILKEIEKGNYEFTAIGGRAGAGPAPAEIAQTPPDDRARLDFCDALAAGAATAAPRHLRDRAVGAILVDAGGRVLAAAANSNHANKTLHAEVNLLQGYHENFRAPLPAGARIYVSLKPCRMCAAMIRYCSPADAVVQVTYRRDDPGRWARHAYLDGAAET